MTIPLNITSVDFVAQGVTGALDLAALPDASIEYIVTYGARRVMQDAINSAAKKARDDEEEFDAELFVQDKIAKLVAGEVSQRGSGGGGVDTVMRAMMKAIRPQVKTGDAARYKNADTATRDKMVVDYIAAMPDAQRDALRAHAEKLIAIDAAKPKLSLDLTI